MEPQPIDDGVLRRYLLGQLTKAEQARCEEGYFSEDALFEQLLLVESELVDAYVRGELPEADRRRFEGSFLGLPGRRRRVAFARTLQQRLSSTVAVEPRPAERRDSGSGGRALLAHLRGQTAALRLSLAGAALLLALLGIGLTVQLTRMRSERDQARAALAAYEHRERDRQRQAARERAGSDEPTSGLQGEQRRQGSPVGRAGPGGRDGRRAVSLLLTAGLVRDVGRANRLEIPAEADSVRLELALEEAGFPSYQAVLQTASGREVGRRGSLEARRLPTGDAVQWVVSASLLAAGDYVVLLQGAAADGRLEDVGEYAFRVVRK